MRATKAELQKEVDRLILEATRQRLICITLGSQSFVFDFDNKLEIPTAIGFMTVCGKLGSYR